jgi:hypothetical protein
MHPKARGKYTSWTDGDRGYIIALVALVARHGGNVQGLEHPARNIRGSR